MDAIAAAFLDKSRTLITADYLPKIERCLDRLSDADIWWRPNEASNSIGNLILHLCGNVDDVDRRRRRLAAVRAAPAARVRRTETDTGGRIAEPPQDRRTAGR